MADLPGAPPSPESVSEDVGDQPVRDALERANESLVAASEELQTTLQLLEERTLRMHACDAILHAVLAEATEIFIGVDDDGRIEAWSRGTDDHFERSADQALGRRLSEFLEGDAGEVVSAVRSLLQDDDSDDDHMRIVESEGVVFRIRRVSDGGRGLVVITLAG